MADELTAAGLSIDSLEDRIDAFVGELQARISPNIIATTDTPEGQFIRIFCERAQSLAELIQYVHSAQYPYEATGKSLDGIASIIGLTRRPATKSYVYAVVDIDPGVYPAGTLVAAVSSNPSAQFTNFSDAFNESEEPTTYGVYFIALEPGPTQVPIGTLTVIVNPVTGWNSVTNSVAGTPGMLEENDYQLRIRIAEEHTSGSSSVDGIHNALMDLDGLLWASVRENITDETDENGTPPHGIQVTVHAQTVTNQQVANAIFENKAAGIATVGAYSYDIADSSSVLRRIYFNRAQQVNVYIEVDIEYFESLYDGDADLAAALETHCEETFGVGDDVSIAQIIHGIMDNINGIHDITEVRVGRAASPTQTTNLAMSAIELAIVSAARITVFKTAA